MVHRAVFDANVYVSAAVHPDGVPGQLLDRYARGDLQLILSAEIVREIRCALSYPEVRKAIRAEVPVEQWLRGIVLLAHFVDDRPLAGICSDPDDDKYVAAALEGRAGFIVTGDKGFLALEEHEGVRIVTPGAFLELL